MGAGFVVIGYKIPALGTQIPLACLLLGSAFSVVATVMGWSFSTVQGYGGWNRFDAAMLDKEIFWHRWSAVILTALSVTFALIALWSTRTGSRRGTMTWKLGLLVCAGIVGAVGHQGGEMTYGADFYPEMLRVLIGGNSD